MRILFLHPNHHSGGAGIAGNWPPAWVADLTGYLKDAGFHDVHFIDAMTHHLDDEAVRERIAVLRPDIVSEAKFIVGLENETVETLEETHQMARDWHPDMANMGHVHALALQRPVPRPAHPLPRFREIHRHLRAPVCAVRASRKPGGRSGLRGGSLRVRSALVTHPALNAW